MRHKLLFKHFVKILFDKLNGVSTTMAIVNCEEATITFIMAQGARGFNSYEREKSVAINKASAAPNK